MEIPLAVFSRTLQDSRVFRDFKKQPEDFGCLKDYNDYLEMVEDVIYNLANNIDIIETNKTIQTYKDANKEQILKNRIKPTKESLELEDLLLEERSLRAKVSKEQQILEDAEKAARIRNKEKLIDDLMFGDEDAEKILEQHREEVLKQEKKKIVFSTGNQLLSTTQKGWGGILQHAVLNPFGVLYGFVYHGYIPT